VQPPRNAATKTDTSNTMIAVVRTGLFAYNPLIFSPLTYIAPPFCAFVNLCASLFAPQEKAQAKKPFRSRRGRTHALETK
jgi:hypothetical protein